MMLVVALGWPLEMEALLPPFKPLSATFPMPPYTTALEWAAAGAAAAATSGPLMEARRPPLQVLGRKVHSSTSRAAAASRASFKRTSFSAAQETARANISAPGLWVRTRLDAAAAALNAAEDPSPPFHSRASLFSPNPLLAEEARAAARATLVVSVLG